MVDERCFEGEEAHFPVKIYTLGRFSVIDGSEALRFSGKAQRRPLDLLKALIALGGRNVSEYQLAEALWPDAEGDAAHQTLTTTLYRIRKLLGRDVVERQERHLTLNPEYCWVDCWMVERLLSNDRLPLNEGWRRITALYHRPFLSQEEDAAWAIPMRERLHSKVVQYLHAAGKGLYKAGSYEEAIETYQRGLEIDDLVEDFYQGLMRSLQASGKRCDAIRVYRRCQKVMSSRLGVEPSNETIRLYQDVRGPE